MVLKRPRKYKYLTVKVGISTPSEEYAVRFFPDLPQDINWKMRNVIARLLWLKANDLLAYNKEIRKFKFVHRPPIIIT